MKVFSKGNKANKSTPSLNVLLASHHPIVASKHKASTKIKTFKQIIAQNIQQTANKSYDLRLENNSRPKTGRDKANFSNDKDEYSNRDHNKNRAVIPSVKMITSIEYKNIKTEGDLRSSTESVQKIESIVYYGRQFNQNQNTSNYQKNSNNEPTKDTKNNDLKLITPISIEKLGKENLYTNFINKSCQRDLQSKKMNHYKNTRLNYYNKPVIRKLALRDFKIGKKIGRGRFGSVHIAQEKSTGCIYALKKIDLVQVKEEQMENQIMEQIRLQLYMNHPNILKMYGFFREGNDICLILEYAVDKCLFSKLAQKIEQKEVSYYCRQMIKSLKYCHSEFILHRDLKPENILLCFGVAKLADFGWAAYSPKYKRVTFCGTLDYVPPEILKGHEYDQRVDIWSLGVLIYQLATGHAPFEAHGKDSTMTEQLTMNRILECNITIPHAISQQLRSLIESILILDPTKRLSLDQIQSSIWMSKFKEYGLDVCQSIWQFWVNIADK